MLEFDAEHWWNNTQRSLTTLGAPITRDEFKEVFLENYFPHSIHIQKEIKFLQIRQGEMTVAEYLAKFESLARFGRLSSLKRLETRVTEFYQHLGA